MKNSFVGCAVFTYSFLHCNWRSPFKQDFPEKGPLTDRMAFYLVTGKLVYGNMGFVDAGHFRTQVEGEEEYLDTPAMVLKKGTW